LRLTIAEEEGAPYAVAFISRRELPRNRATRKEARDWPCCGLAPAPHRARAEPATQGPWSPTRPDYLRTTTRLLFFPSPSFFTPHTSRPALLRQPPSLLRLPPCMANWGVGRAGTVMDELAGPSDPRKDAIAGHCHEFMKSIRVLLPTSFPTLILLFFSFPYSSSVILFPWFRADEASGRSIPFVFLDRVKDDFMQRYGASIDAGGCHPLADRR
ncbi:hypothetical protein Taro_008365, partial [Colocasia esculenta]|nr:hypothetical protein [Colocasia esculenta]